MSKSILSIPDPHDEVGVNQDRFEWAGNLAVVRQPEVIVCLGDGTSMDSLSSYDVGTVHAEGRRYSEDVHSFRQAMDRFHGVIDKYNSTRGRIKKKKYNPRLIYTIGNHEQRIMKAIKQDPKLIGTMSIEDLMLTERGWEVYPLTVPAEAFGVAFAHYFTSGIMGRPISGINHSRNLVAKTYTSAVVGHSHDRSFWEDTDVFGNKVIGIVGGCYFEHKLKYTSEDDRNWRGLLMLTVEQQEVNPEFIGMEQIKREYA